MSGSWLGRGRVGRIAVYCLSLVILIFIIYVVRTRNEELEKLRESNAECIAQQETLTSRLQEIYTYKLRLETNLKEEKNANAVVKEELEDRANKEREKEEETLERIQALQQNCNILQTKHDDLLEDLVKLKNKSADKIKELEGTINELKLQLKKAAEDKHKSIENMKSAYLEIETEKKRIEDKYNKLIASAGNVNSTINHLHKENMQLQRALDESKKHFMVAGVGVPSSQVSPRQAKSSDSGIEMLQAAKQQVSPPTKDSYNPEPIQSPQNYQSNDDTVQNDNADDANNDQANNVMFGSRNGNIVPLGPNDLKTSMPYVHTNDNNNDNNQEAINAQPNDVNNVEDDSARQALPPPYVIRHNIKLDKKVDEQTPSSRHGLVIPLLKPQIEKRTTESNDLKNLRM